MVAKRAASPLRQSLSYVLQGLLVTAVLVVGKMGLEQTWLGAWFEQRTYAMLVKTLPQFREKGQSVLVIDISHLPGGTLSPDGRLAPTSRDELRKLLDTLVMLQPRAVAIDVDFSPDAVGWIAEQDPSFFDHCLRLSRSMPIVLGVHRTLREPRAGWLGLPRYAPLAGALWLSGEGLERVPAWIAAPHVDERMPSLGAALAHARHGERQGPLHHLQPWVHQFRERTHVSPLHPDGLRIGDVLINYAGVGQLISETVRVTQARELVRHADRIQGRMVLLGVADGASDLFHIPVLDRFQPGVFVHASTAFTLASDPVYELNHPARLALDFTVSLLALLVVVWTRRGKVEQNQQARAAAQARALGGAVVGVLLVGFLVVYAARIFWLDFLLVIVFLLLHPALERRFHRVVH